MPHVSACQKLKMHTQRRYATCFACQKKKREDKDRPYLKKEKQERDGSYKGVHPSSTKNIHTLAHLDQCLWLVSPLHPIFWLSKIWEASLPLYPPYLQLHRKEALGVGWKERHKNRPFWGIMQKWAIREIIEELHFCFSKIL